MTRPPLKCCGCGAVSPDGVKPCDCATMCGYREGEKGSVWFMTAEQAEQAKIPALIESLRSRAEKAEAEAEAMRKKAISNARERNAAEATCEKLATALERIPVKLRRMALDKFEEGKQAASINIRNAAQLAEDIAAEALSAYRNVTTVNASGPKGETPENCRDGGADADPR